MIPLIYPPKEQWEMKVYGDPLLGGGGVDPNDTC